QGVVMLFGVDHGEPLAVIDASSITAIRTAAVSGVATRVLARPDASDLAILGSGVQAASHLEAMRAVRPLRRVRVWSRTAAHAREFAHRESARHRIGVEACDSPHAAVAGADLICTATAARDPVLSGAWIASGAHINAVGACFKTSRELDTAAVARARLYVDRRESALNEAGDFLIARAVGAMALVPPRALARGVWTASAGNMAQGLAWQARRLGIPCAVVAPDHAPDIKLQAISRLGARVLRVPFPEWWRAITQHAHPGME